MSLQERAKAFLNRPIPEGMAYAPDSISERLIREYAAAGNAGTIREDPELLELLAICVMEAEAVAEAKSGEEKAFFEESAAILRAIYAEAEGAR